MEDSPQEVNPAPESLKDLFDQGTSVHGRAATDTRVVTAKGDIDWQELAVLNGYADAAELLKELYVIRGLSITTLAARLNLSPATIRIALIKAQIPTRRRGGRRNIKGLNCVEEALRRNGLPIEHLLIIHETPYRVAKALDIKPHQVYSYIRVMKIKMQSLRPLDEEAMSDMA